MQPFIPTLTTLATALKLEMGSDPAGQRAAENALGHLLTNPTWSFDGTELRITSQSRGKNVEHVTDGQECTCEGNRHAWCKHRALFRLLLAQAVLRDPGLLRACIAQQTLEPVGV